MIILKLKKNIRRVIEKFKLYREVLKDSNRYYKAASWAGPVNEHSLEHIEADLIRHYHVVEKGLAMPNYKAKSGTAIVSRLVDLIIEWEQGGGDIKSKQYLAAVDTVIEYRAKHEAMGIDVSNILSNFSSKVENLGKISSLGGVRSSAGLALSDKDAFYRIMQNRHSVRVFHENKVPSDDALRAAVSLAIRTPSVCNRQTWRTHIYHGDECQNILKCQNGNRGFGHTIPVVMIVTVDMRYFSEIVERFQPWIEGGLFSMSLMLALDAQGIGNVPLNWSRSNVDDEKLRKVAKLEPYERVIMMIGCGYANEDAMVPISCRNDVDWFIRWHK